ncbi:hypothetical protein LLF88_00075 [bacterium]|nr:hypothetical protein [bacterium]
MQEKQHAGKEIALRYLRARKKEKGIILQEFCATTGYNPPYAGCHGSSREDPDKEQGPEEVSYFNDSPPPIAARLRGL